MSTLQEKLAGDAFVVTVEILPPKGVATAAALSVAHGLRDYADAMNVTDQHSARMTLGPLALCHRLIDEGIEPIMQMTTRDRNRIALQSDLLSAYVLGVRNLLCLTGDPVNVGDHPDAKPVFDLDSVGLVRGARGLEAGHTLGGGELEGAPQFFIGGAASPSAEPLERQLGEMERKVAAGVEFFQTQPVFAASDFERFAKGCARFGAPILAGIMLVKSARQARFMNERIPGIRVPNSIIDDYEGSADPVRICVSTTSALIRELRPLCRGVHIMAVGWEQHVPEILDAAGVGTRVAGAR